MIDCEKCSHYCVCDCDAYKSERCCFFEEARPHGVWIADDWIRDVNGEFYRLYACSKCGYKAIKHYPFCVCGADMRKKEGESSNDGR